VIRVLLLGGTAEARALAAALFGRSDVEVVSSLAGRVQRPRLPVGPVRVGGFGGADSLAAWLHEHEMAAVIDATHPYAEGIRRSALIAAPAAGVAYLRLERQNWIEQPGDRWHRVATFDAAASCAAGLGRRIFLTIGRQNLRAFTGLPDRWILARIVDEPDPPPPDMALLRSRGPYTVDGETALLTDHRIDVLVTKDSGGALTEAKLVAARRLGVPVVMVDRPVPPDLPVGAVVADVAAAVRWVDRLAQPG
jgi:precorrin-6A/cobalt-precorrin-6A reductase